MEVAAEEPHRTRTHRKDSIGEVDERTYNKIITKLSKATAHVVRYGPSEQTWYDQQEIVKQFKKYHKKRVWRSNAQSDDLNSGQRRFARR